MHNQFFKSTNICFVKIKKRNLPPLGKRIVIVHFIKIRNKKIEPQKIEKVSESSSVTRHISPEIRERVFEKADYQCEYHGSDGVRCSSRTGLQIEHSLPFAIYRSNDEQYLKIFCKAHNHFAAEEFYGRKFIEQKIKEQRVEICSLEK